SLTKPGLPLPDPLTSRHRPSESMTSRSGGTFSPLLTLLRTLLRLELAEYTGESDFTVISDSELASTFSRFGEPTSGVTVASTVHFAVALETCLRPFSDAVRGDEARPFLSRSEDFVRLFPCAEAFELLGAL